MKYIFAVTTFFLLCSSGIQSAYAGQLITDIFPIIEEGDDLDSDSDLKLNNEPGDFDCTIRRTLFVNTRVGSIVVKDGIAYDHGNWTTSKGKACSQLEPTIYLPQSDCVGKYIYAGSCPSGALVLQAEFGITRAHAWVLPIEFREACNAGGKNVLITNNNFDKNIIATIEVTSTSVPTKIEMATLSPGERKTIGCTLVDGDARNYKVLTAEFE